MYAAPHSPAASPADRLSRVEFVAMLAAVMALNALAIDTMLPALGDLARELGAPSSNDRQLVVGLFLGGLGVGSLVHGPLSDRFGRRRVLLFALAGYVAMALLCGLAGNFQIMLAGRLLHGLVSAALGVVSISIVRDRYVGDQMAQLLSTVFMVFMVVPILAPSLGQLIMHVAGWREIFHVLAVMGVVMFVWIWRRLPETLDPANVVSLEPRRLLREWSGMIRNRSATSYMIASTFAQGGLYGYLNSAPQIFTDQFNAERFFPTAFALVAVTMAASNFLNSRIVRKIGARRVSQSALLGYILLAFLQVLAAIYRPTDMWLFLALIALNMSMIGLIGSNFGSISMEPFGRIAGSASSFQQAFRTTIAALIGGSTGALYNGTALPMACGFLLCGALALGLVIFAERGRLFTRPGTAVIGRY